MLQRYTFLFIPAIAQTNLRTFSDELTDYFSKQDGLSETYRQIYEKIELLQRNVLTVVGEGGRQKGTGYKRERTVQTVSPDGSLSMKGRRQS